MVEHYCQEHGVVFFKRGGMKSYAHPIKDEKGGDTGKWCNEGSESEQEAKVAPLEKPVKSDTVDNKNKSFALVYAKDLAVAGVIAPPEIISWAKAFEAFLNGILVVKDDNVFRQAIEHCSIKGKGG